MDVNMHLNHKIKNRIFALFLIFLIPSVFAININTDSVYQEDMTLKGEIIINLDTTDHVSELALIRFSSDTKQYEFPLNNISSKEIKYSPVDFSLRIIEKKIEENQEIGNSTMNEVVVINETVKEDNLTGEINNSEKVPEQNNSIMEINQTAPITGGVIGGFFRTIFNFFQRLIMTGKVTSGEDLIQGQVKFGEQVVYNLSEKQSFEVVEGNINLEMKDNQAVITTNYSEEKTQTFKINLENLNLLFEEREIIILIMDNETELISKKISLDKKTESKELTGIKLSISEDEKKILENKFENETMKLVEQKQVGDRLIIRYSLEEYWFEPSYDLEANEQEKEDDKIRWLKDLAKTISEAD